MRGACLLFCWVAAGLLTGCYAPPAPKLQLVAASSLRHTLTQLQPLAQKNGLDFNVSYASSGALASQLANGLQADLFLSADSARPLKLYEQGVGAKPPSRYAMGRLVLMSTKQNVCSHIRSSGVPALTGVSSVALANPKLAPYGAAASQTLQHAGLSLNHIKVVTAHNLSHSFLLTTQAADAGFVSLSDWIFYTHSSHFQSTSCGFKVSSTAHQAIEHMLLELNHAKHTHDFAEFLASKPAQAVFAANGFETP